jgi:hypothetical protein
MMCEIMVLIVTWLVACGYFSGRPGVAEYNAYMFEENLSSVR